MLNFYGMWKSGTAKPPKQPMRQMHTPWGERLEADNVWPEHPHPQFARESFIPLNGYWDYAFVDACEPEGSVGNTGNGHSDGLEFEGKILVPFSPESMLSGVGRQLQPDEILVYRRFFDKPEELGNHRLILHFEAVDYGCDCYLNGQSIGSHLGGYLPFEFDITDLLTDSNNDLTVCVWDPSDAGVQPRGKQKLESGVIWYTAQSGIWQPVWMEVVPESHVESIEYHPDLDSRILRMKVRTTGEGTLDVKVKDEGGRLAGRVNVSLTNPVIDLEIPVGNVRAWSPEDPHLYDVEISFGDDRIYSYCAFRTVSLGRRPESDPLKHRSLFSPGYRIKSMLGLTDNAHRRVVLLNGKPVFIKGLLDQGYWSDGLMTAPCDDALIHDIEAAKSLGFNMLRKHIKIENDRYYYHCDRLGMLVWQDMVQGGTPYDPVFIGNIPTLFRFMWSRFSDIKAWHQRKLGSATAEYQNDWKTACAGTVKYLRNHPSIIAWTLFNEGWGQFDARSAEKMVRQLDGSRLIDTVSGWYDMHSGDFQSVHNYFRKLRVYRDYRRARHLCRAFVLSEFGGYTYHVPQCSSYATSYGYMQFDDLGRWRKAVLEILDEAERLGDDGLAGYVYTQLSDVEEETNGLLTFDRRVNKVTGETDGLEA